MAVSKAAVIFKSVGAKLMAAEAVYPSIADVTYTLEVLDYVSSETAEAGTTSTSIKITGHGLQIGDMIVNTTRRSTGIERGARVVTSTGFDADTLPVSFAISGQTSGDTVRMYKYTDRTGSLQPGSFLLSRKGLGQSSLSFNFITTASYMLLHGMYVRIKATVGAVTTVIFTGRVTSVEDELLGPWQTKIMQPVTCQGLSAIAANRTVTLDEADGSNYGGIAQTMVVDYLQQDGIGLGNIDVGETLLDDWISEAISIKEVLDECASKSGFVWYVNDAGELTFELPSATIPYANVPVINSGFSKYTRLRFSVDSTDFYNKIFICGGDDEVGNPIILAYEDFAMSTAQQNAVGGTGVAGIVKRDASLVDADYRTIEAGSTTTTILLTAHGQTVGDIVWNFSKNEKRQVLTVPDADSFTAEAFSAVAGPSSDSAESGTTTTNIKITGHSLTARDTMIYNETRDAYRWVLAVPDADNLTVASVTGQTTGDTIKYAGDIFAFFKQANIELKNLRTKQGVDPTVMTFESPVAFEPMTKIKVDLPNIGRVGKYFLIEDVDIRDIGRGLSNCWYSIRATARNSDEIIGNRKITYTDYWKEF